MKKLLALAATMIVCAVPALAQDDRPDAECKEPQTTGSLHTERHRPAFMGSPLTSVDVTPPEESWQEQAREDAERHRRVEIEGCRVD